MIAVNVVVLLRILLRIALTTRGNILCRDFGVDPATLGEDALRDYILHVKMRKGGRPKTIRQTMACARLFFVEMLGLGE